MPQAIRYKVSSSCGCLTLTENADGTGRTRDCYLNHFRGVYYVDILCRHLHLAYVRIYFPENKHYVESQDEGWCNTENLTLAVDYNQVLDGRFNGGAHG